MPASSPPPLALPPALPLPRLLCPSRRRRLRFFASSARLATSPSFGQPLLSLALPSVRRRHRLRLTAARARSGPEVGIRLSATLKQISSARHWTGCCTAGAAAAAGCDRRHARLSNPYATAPAATAALDEALLGIGSKTALSSMPSSRGEAVAVLNNQDFSESSKIVWMGILQAGRISGTGDTALKVLMQSLDASFAAFGTSRR